MPDDTPIPNTDMVSIYLDHAHDARIRADHAGACSAAQIAQVYALLALNETLTPERVTVVSKGPFADEFTADEVDAT